MQLHYNLISHTKGFTQMRNAIIEEESTLTDRYQTTVPEAVRKALHLTKRDKIHYVIQKDGRVIISRAENKIGDPILSNFLSFLAKEIQKNPQNMKALTGDLHQRIQSLVSGVEFDLNQPLSDEDE